MANLKSISHICHPILMAFVWELTKETIDVHLGCLQSGKGIFYKNQKYTLPTRTSSLRGSEAIEALLQSPPLVSSSSLLISSLELSDTRVYEP